MDLYGFSLTLGGAGLLFMGLRGMSRGSSGGHGGHSGHAGGGHAGHGAHALHSHGGGHGGHATHAGQGHAHAGGNASAGHGSTTGRMALSLLSPRMLFSFLLGMGTTGVVLRPLMGGGANAIIFIFAVLGGIAFERFFVGPLWNFMLRFESSPAATLESAIDDEAKAVTNFDDSGHGLISIEVDGQMVQCLGTLSAGDREAGVRVRAGDMVRIEDVDAARNRCTVRRA